jgi:hypothetical protein
MTMPSNDLDRIVAGLSEVAALARELISLREAGFSGAALAFPRDELALEMLCAFNNCPPRLAPNGWRYFPNEATKKAWQRVAEAARARLLAPPRKIEGE